MTADAAPSTDGFERSDLTDDTVRDSLVALLGAHAIAVWGYGQRDAYSEWVMAGPGLDHWVRTGNLWAEQERNLWEWEQMVAGLTDTDPDAVVAAALGDVATRFGDELRSWIDLMLCAAYIDGLGEALVRSLDESAYAPLRRHAQVMVMYKRGQYADGVTALGEVATLGQLPVDDVAARRRVWAELAREMADVIATVQNSAGWVAFGLAAPIQADETLDRVDARLDEHFQEVPCRR